MLISDLESSGNFLLNAVRKPARTISVACNMGMIRFPGGIFASNSICATSIGSNLSTMAEISSEVRVLWLAMDFIALC